MIGQERAPNELWRRTNGLRQVRPVASGGDGAPALLVMHGDDELAPQIDARLLADAHGSARAQYHLGAGHRLCHDPHAVGLLLGWLNRQRAYIQKQEVVSASQPENTG